MQETDLNRIIFSSIRQEGHMGYKISDDASSFTSTVKKPFDGFAVKPDGCFYIESKLIKGTHTSFNFNLLKEHQYDYLSLIKEISLKHRLQKIYPLVCIGWWVSRKLFDLLFFDIALITYLKNKSIESIKKKEITKMSKFFIPIKKQKFDSSLIVTNIIDVKRWRELDERYQTKV